LDLGVGIENRGKWWSEWKWRMRWSGVDVTNDMRRIKFVRRLLRYAMIQREKKSGGLIMIGWMRREMILECYICCGSVWCIEETEIRVYRRKTMIFYAWDRYDWEKNEILG
jgi:hypothetical protein